MDLDLLLDDDFDRKPPRSTYPVEFHPHPCPDCGARLVHKPGKYGWFYGCQNYRRTFCHGSITDRDAIPISSALKIARYRLSFVVTRREFIEFVGSHRRDLEILQGWRVDQLNLEECRQLEALAIQEFPKMLEQLNALPDLFERTRLERLLHCDLDLNDPTPPSIPPLPHTSSQEPPEPPPIPAGG